MANRIAYPNQQQDINYLQRGLTLLPSTPQQVPLQVASNDNLPPIAINPLNEQAPVGLNVVPLEPGGTFTSEPITQQLQIPQSNPAGGTSTLPLAQNPIDYATNPTGELTRSLSKGPTPEVPTLSDQQVNDLVSQAGGGQEFSFGDIFSNPIGTYVGMQRQLGANQLRNQVLANRAAYQQEQARAPYLSQLGLPLEPVINPQTGQYELQDRRVGITTPEYQKYKALLNALGSQTPMDIAVKASRIAVNQSRQAVNEARKQYYDIESKDKQVRLNALAHAYDVLDMVGQRHQADPEASFTKIVPNFQDQALLRKFFNFSNPEFSEGRIKLLESRFEASQDLNRVLAIGDLMANYSKDIKDENVKIQLQNSYLDALNKFGIGVEDLQFLPGEGLGAATKRFFGGYLGTPKPELGKSKEAKPNIKDELKKKYNIP